MDYKSVGRQVALIKQAGTKKILRAMISLARKGELGKLQALSGRETTRLLMRAQGLGSHVPLSNLGPKGSRISGALAEFGRKSVPKSLGGVLPL